MNPKLIAPIIIFSSLTIVLSQIRIPLPFPPPGFSYQLYQIPIAIAFMLFGVKCGITVASINMIANMLVPKGIMGVFGPPLEFLVTLSLLFAIYTFK